MKLCGFYRSPSKPLHDKDNLYHFYQNHLSVCQELEKQLQFTTGEKNKIQHALGVVKRQWEEHQTTCGGNHKVYAL